MKQTFALLPLWLLLPVFLSAQTIGNFPSVQPTAQTQGLVLPATHGFQRLLRSGTTLSSGETVGNNLDFTGYVPIGGSSTAGYLSVSHETFPAGVSILNLSFNNGTKLWNVNSGGNVAFPFAAVGYVSAFCAGTVTPANRILVCEETASIGDVNGDGYNDDGWMIEIDPATRTVINQDGVGGVDKLWAMGRQKHEDIVIAPDQSVAYWSADYDLYGYVYKFVPTTPGNFSVGQLYVLKTTAALGTGTWEAVPNTTQADRNNTISLSQAAGAYNFSRVEGIEIGPDGKLYFATTTSGRIYRFRDLGTATGVDQLDVFVEPDNFDVDGAGPFPPEPWGTGADNIAFDGEGNLWVLQDGGRSHIWVVAPDHTAANPKVRLFATTPAGSEPTGITFSPDYRFLFLSIQHPLGNNTAAQTDAAGASVVFDQSTTVVIARKENLGTNVTLPIGLLQFGAAQTAGGVALEWTLPLTTDDEFVVERSADNRRFVAVGAVKEPGSKRMHYLDAAIPTSGLLYYRLLRKTTGGRIFYSDVRTVRLSGRPAVLMARPSPATDRLQVTAPGSGNRSVIFKIVNAAGVVMKNGLMVAPGQTTSVELYGLHGGLYYLVPDGGNGAAVPFLKL